MTGEQWNYMQADQLWSTLKSIVGKRHLINRENLSRFVSLARQGRLLEALRKVRRKLRPLEVPRGIFFLNDSLEPQEASPREAHEAAPIDIIVPIYNAYAYTVKCIQSVYDHTETPYHLYLIDDCSSDERIGQFLQELETRERPEPLLELSIIRHEENLGFIGTINDGLARSSHNVVILNTDAEVPPRWSGRLMQPIWTDPLTASVTPFSNCATICSFPAFCKDNLLPEGMDLPALDAIFSRYGGTRPFEIPTGVGFCMAMSRKVLRDIGGFDPVYGKGYAEENDWCRRAVKKGYRNVMVTDLFVYHKHGVSFGEIVTKTKQQRIDENLAILAKRYPDYSAVVSDYIAADPVGDLRAFLAVIVHRAVSEKKAVLVLNHSIGGGATTYIERRMAAHPQIEYFYAELLPDGVTLRVTTVNAERQDVLYFDYGRAGEGFLRQLAECLRIGKLVINQLIHYPLEKTIAMVLASGLAYEFFVHDFYCVCPKYILLNAQEEYCHAEKRPQVCSACLQDLPEAVDIRKWREDFHRLLRGAAAVTAPSRDTAQIVSGYYPDLSVRVLEHPVPAHVHRTADRVRPHGRTLNISVLGAIGVAKGSRIVYALADAIAREKLPMKITVIGYTNLHNEAYENEAGTLKILGPYRNEEVSDLLAKVQTDVVLLPSIWPETYSYTTSEAIYSGYRVLAFDIGAPADRIRETGRGWLVQEISSDAVLRQLVEIDRERQATMRQDHPV